MALSAPLYEPASGGAHPQYSTESLTTTKAKMEEFLASEEKLKQCRQFLMDDAERSTLSPMQKTTLKMLERTFGCYIMESDNAKQQRTAATQIEAKLESARNQMTLGLIDPASGDFKEMSSVARRDQRKTTDSGLCEHHSFSFVLPND